MAEKNGPGPEPRPQQYVPEVNESYDEGAGDAIKPQDPSSRLSEERWTEGREPVGVGSVPRHLPEDMPANTSEEPGIGGIPAQRPDVEEPWRVMSRALAGVADAWHIVGAAQVDESSERTPDMHQLSEEDAEELARKGYQATEALVGVANLLSGQEGAGTSWEATQSALRDSWRKWRVAMDVQSADETTPR